MKFPIHVYLKKNSAVLIRNLCLFNTCVSSKCCDLKIEQGGAARSSICHSVIWYVPPFVLRKQSVALRVKIICTQHMCLTHSTNWILVIEQNVSHLICHFFLNYVEKWNKDLWFLITHVLKQNQDVLETGPDEWLFYILRFF